MLSIPQSLTQSIAFDELQAKDFAWLEPKTIQETANISWNNTQGKKPHQFIVSSWTQQRHTAMLDMNFMRGSESDHARITKKQTYQMIESMLVRP